jgi:serine/threonine protein kinase
VRDSATSNWAAATSPRRHEILRQGAKRIGKLQGENISALDFLTPSDRPGCLAQLGPYEVLERIGQGSMGVVLKALDERLARVVAIKVLAPALTSSTLARRRFEREARAAAAVCHAHVVTIHAVDE